eukprot:CAMPEP_0197057696 /NCGR_PEP_ID=MMETSP1384-20130603/99779_1 /TAXON_ID=29189 /ORGANISM="Ammonia sp." /LENGTH=58 /DNA_ID=CAMNT_0042492203 /DNA_START=110 /DNA_END=282 /DNA_ORIENTATION=+
MTYMDPETTYAMDSAVPIDDDDFSLSDSSDSTSTDSSDYMQSTMYPMDSASFNSLSSS